MAIPLSALRRALAEFSRDGTRGAQLGFALGAGPDAIMDLTDGDGEYNPGRTIDRGIQGALLGAGGGAGLGMAIRGGVNLAGFGTDGMRSLREVLAEQAAARGSGRRAVREAADVEDAATFSAASARRDVPLVEEMRSAGERPFARMPDAMDEMQELQAASRILRRLKQERRVATDPEDVADLDQQIAELTRLLGG